MPDGAVCGRAPNPCADGTGLPHFRTPADITCNRARCPICSPRRSLIIPRAPRKAKSAENVKFSVTADSPQPSPRRISAAACFRIRFGVLPVQSSVCGSSVFPIERPPQSTSRHSRSAELFRIPIYIILKDQRRRQLVHAFLALLPAHSGIRKIPMRADRRQPLVVKHRFDPGLLLESCRKVAALLRSRTRRAASLTAASAFLKPSARISPAPTAMLPLLPATASPVRASPKSTPRIILDILPPRSVPPQPRSQRS